MTGPGRGAVPSEGSAGDGAAVPPERSSDGSGYGPGYGTPRRSFRRPPDGAASGSGFPALSAVGTPAEGPFNRSAMSVPDGMLDSMSSRTISPALVGRAGEISRLRSAFASVREGAPAAVLIGGEAGVGKSRLIREFTAAERGAERGAGARVLIGG